MPDAARIAQANALEVPVTIQGSKIVEGTEQRELFTETTKTTLTFDNGAVLNLKARVLAGQSVFLRNEQSGREILCRVLESPPEGQTGYTDLEFTVHDPEFWATPAEKPAAAAQTSEIQEMNEAAGKSPVAASIREDLAPNYEEAPAPPPETPTPLPSSHLPETTEASPEPPEAVEPNDAKDEEQLAALLAKEAKRAAKRATAARESKQVEQAPGIRGCGEPERDNLGHRRQGKNIFDSGVSAARDAPTDHGQERGCRGNRRVRPDRGGDRFHMAHRARHIYSRRRSTVRSLHSISATCASRRCAAIASAGFGCCRGRTGHRARSVGIEE